MMDNRKKILYIITKSIWGGATKYTCDLAVNLPRDQFEVFVAAGGKNELYEKLKDTDVAYSEIKHFQKSVNPFKDLLAFFEILRLIRRIRPDIVHVSSSKAGGLAGIAVFILKLLKAGSQKLKAIFTAHGWAYHEDRPKLQKQIIKYVSRLTASFYDKIITVSEYDRLSAIRNNIAGPEKLVTIHNGISAESINFLPKAEAQKTLFTNFSKWESLGGVTKDKLLSENKPTENFVVGTIGEFVKNKGHKFLIEAARELTKKYSDMKFLIVGHHGEEKSNLELQVKDYELDNSVFIVKSPPNAARYMKAFDIFILPSLKEGLPYVLLEAGLAELPVIATSVGGNSEIIDSGKEGFLIDEGDAEDIIETVNKMLDNSELRKGLANNLHKKILEKFSFRQMLVKTIQAYLD